MSQPLFFEDREGEASDVDLEKEDHGDEPEADVPLPSIAVANREVPKDSERAALTNGKKKPAWVDEDDNVRVVDISRVKRRKKLRKKLGEDDISAADYAERMRNWNAENTAVDATGPGGWAELPSTKRASKKHDNEDDSGEDSQSDDDVALSGSVTKLLRSTTGVLSDRKRITGKNAAQQRPTLQSGNLNIRQLANANQEDPNQAEARCVDFHPSGHLLLTAGLDKTLRIFQVDGERNAKVQGIHIKNFPIHTAKFTGGGSQVVMAGRRRFFHQLDMETGTVSTLQTLLSHEERAWEKFEVSADGSMLAFLGQQGKILLVSNQTKQEVGQLRLNSAVAKVSFSSSGTNENQIYASSVDGTVYLWDTRRMSCIDKHKDEGAVHSTSLATSTDHYATGSDSGVVNLYSTTSLRAADDRPIFGVRTEKPRKSFFNLTTPIDNITFNKDGKLMAFSSYDKKNAIRIAHVPSMTVFANWPSGRSNIRRVCAMSFSPNSGYLAIGNDKGDVQLMRIGAYPAS